MKKTREQGLTERQKVFIAAYTGNATKAALAAGCSMKSAAITGSKWLKMPKIQRAIASRDPLGAKAHIRSRTELQERWSEKAFDDSIPVRDQLKASELLEKSRGGFTSKVEIKGELTLLDLVNESMNEPSNATTKHEEEKPE